MTSPDAIKGRAWAQSVYEQKLASGDLPNLGRGYPDEVRAARAVQSIAERKLYVKAKRSSLKLEAPLPARDKRFWRGVQAWALEQEILVDHPNEWAAASAAVVKFVATHGELDDDDLEFLQRKHPDVLLAPVVSRLESEGALSVLGLEAGELDEAKAKQAVAAHRKQRAEANKKTVELVRVSDGQTVSMPGGTWATNNRPREEREPYRFSRYTKAALERMPAWAGIDHERPNSILWDGGGLHYIGVATLLSCMPPGAQIIVQTGPFVAAKVRKGQIDRGEEYAPAERFVVRGVRAGCDTKNWLNQELRHFDHPRHEAQSPPPVCPVWRVGEHRKSICSRAKKFRDTVLVVAGMPLPVGGAKDIVLDVPGDIICVPVPYRDMLRLGYPARLQPLDTPGQVRVYTDKGAVVAGVWQLGAVGFDPDTDRPRSDETMPCSALKNYQVPGKNPLGLCYKQGIAAYLPAFNNDPDLFGPAVILMGPITELDWTNEDEMWEDVDMDHPSWWQIAPVVW